MRAKVLGNGFTLCGFVEEIGSSFGDREALVFDDMPNFPNAKQARQRVPVLAAPIFGPGQKPQGAVYLDGIGGTRPPFESTDLRLLIAATRLMSSAA